MDNSAKEVNVELLVESCKPSKKRGRPSHKRQLQEIREERKINLQTSDSVVVATNLKSILSLEAFQSLPINSQTQLTTLLPKFDQISHGSDALLKPSPTALSNEYFSRFCAQYVEKLSDNKLSEEAIEQAKNDTTKELSRLDPWKLRNYEPIWGQKLMSQTIDDEDEGKALDCLLKQVIKNNPSKKRHRVRSNANKRKVKKESK